MFFEIEHERPTSPLFPYTTLFRSLGYFGRGMFLAWGILGEPVGLWFVAAGGIAALVATAGPRWLEARAFGLAAAWLSLDRKSTRLNSSHVSISYAVFCLKKKRVRA